MFEMGGVRLPLNGRSGHPAWSLSEYEFFISGSVTDCGFWFLYILFLYIRACLFLYCFLFVLFRNFHFCLIEFCFGVVFWHYNIVRDVL